MAGRRHRTVGGIRPVLPLHLCMCSRPEKADIGALTIRLLER